MQLDITKAEMDICLRLQAAAEDLGVAAYLVGGFVRDKLLGRPCKDIDVVAVGSGIALATAFAKAFKPALNVVVYERFGTAALKLGDFEVEFVGARRESYNRDSRKPVVEDGSLADDQNRRDFTINALAMSLNIANFGDIVDSFGGLQHLKEGKIITPLDPAITFSDDPLRMMRAVRFATQLNFQIAPVTFAAIGEQRERIRIISQERITTELQKIMAAAKPSIGLTLLYKSGLLRLIFPELQAMGGVEEKNGQRHKDNFYHTMQVLDKMAERSDNIWLRWAALLHDIGKPTTKRFELQAGWTFHGHEAVGARMVPRIFQRLKLPLGGELKYVQKLVEMHARPVALSKENITDSALRRLLVESGEELEDLLLLCETDSTTQYEEKRLRYAQNLRDLKEKIETVEAKDSLRNWQPPISGDDIMAIFGISPSKTVGDLKTAIREAILDGEVGNDYEAAKAYLLVEAAKLGLLPK
jgi:tRNA nucleotidyltransferase (CCA-adding enzyme)